MKELLINLTDNENLELEEFSVVSVDYAEKLNFMHLINNTNIPEHIVGIDKLEEYLVTRAGLLIKNVNDYCIENNIDITNGYSMLIDMETFMVKPFIDLLEMVDDSGDPHHWLIYNYNIDYSVAQSEIINRKVYVPIIGTKILCLNNSEEK